MFNVLPQTIKEEIKKEYKRHRMFVIIVFIIFLQVAFLAMLFPSWLISSIKENEVAMKTQEVKRSSTYQDDNITSSVITSINLKLKVVDQSLKYQKLLPIINNILADRSQNIKINQISYESKGNATSTVLIQGVSDTREGLVSFTKKLVDSNSFNGVDSPVSNFTKDKNINFSISLTVTP